MPWRELLRCSAVLGTLYRRDEPRHMIVDAAILIEVRRPMIRHLFHLTETDKRAAQQHAIGPLLQLVSDFVTCKAFHPRVVRLALDGQPAPQAVTRPKSHSAELFGFRRRGRLTMREPKEAHTFRE